MKNNENMNKNENIKILISISIFILYLFTIISLFLIKNNPTKGYEMSIYASTGIDVWILIISSSIGAIILLIYLTFQEKLEKMLVFSIISLLLLNNFIILSIPELRSYIIYGDGDFLTHLGYSKDILSYGKITNEDIYPVVHITISMISLLTNISIISISNYISEYFSILYVLFMFILSKKIFNNQRLSILILVASIPFLFFSFQTELKPQFLSTITIPLILYFLFSKTSWEPKLILILLLLLIQFFHPLTSVFFVLSISMTSMYFLVQKYRGRHDKDSEYGGCVSCGKSIDNDILSSAFKKIFYINIISFIIWISNFYYVWANNLKSFARWLLGESIESSVKVLSPTYGIDKLHMTKLEIIGLLLNMFGQILIYLAITLIFIFWYLRYRNVESKNVEIKKFVRNDQTLIILSIMFMGGIIMQMINMGGGINLSVTRGLNYVMILTPIFVGSFLFLVKARYPRIGSIVICVIISSAWIIGILNIFPSPNIRQPNDQITKSDIYGAEWFFDHKNPDTKFISDHINIRFAHLILGIDASDDRKDLSNYIIDKSSMIPDHFNYDKGSILGQNYSNKYMIISQFDKDLYTIGPWKPVGRFTYEDFEKINQDPSVNNLYDNGELDIYNIMKLNRS